MATKIENQKMINQEYHYDIVDDIQPQLSIKNPPSSSSLSLSTSPSHEFSFTISLESTTKIIDSDDKTTTIHDLTPADEIFFHGHLLPLQILSRHHHHLPTAPVSPRSSTNSMDSFTLPITELLPNNNTSSSKRFHDYYLDNDNNNHLQENRGGKSSKSNFSLFFGISNWRKGSCDQKKEIKDDQRRKLKFDVTRVVKRYMKLVKPLLSFKTAAGRRDHQVLGKPYSLSGNLLLKNKKSGGRRDGAYSSAPVTMRNNSPTDSGHLLPTGILSPTTTSTSDSTMEELQAAIQAAIAHCKKSQLDR